MPDEGAFELSDAGEHGQDHASGGGRGVGPGLLKRLYSRIFLSDHLGDAEQFSRRARKPVEAADDQDVVFAEILQQLLERGSLAGSAGDLFLEQLAAAGFLQPDALQIEALILGRDAGVSELRARCSADVRNLSHKSAIPHGTFAARKRLIFGPRPD